MKKLFLLATATLLLAGCSQDEFTGGSLDQTQTKEITFSMTAPATTRAELTGEKAAQKLGNEFVVYGWKTVPGTPDVQSNVFVNYTVKWNGNVGQTLTNTSGWEYVGFQSQPLSGSPVEQSIKYWDYSAKQYDFLAWRVLAGGAPLLEIKTLEADERKEGTEENYYKEKALHFEPQSITEAGSIYVANQVTISDKSKYQDEVKFEFRNLAAKIRVGIYETISGYSVKDVKFYSDATSTSPTGSDVTFFTATDQFISRANVDVKYRSANNEAVVTSTPTGKTSFVTLGELQESAQPEYLESGSFVGRSSSAASYCQGSDASGWNLVFPNKAAAVLNLKVDYTLVSKEGSGEEIHVYGASANVPAEYANWKANYAYTYLFKISDKTNGKTGKDDDYEGLYPIQFDAVVVATETGNTQETITTINNAAITTYQKGSTVTTTDSYATGNIFVTVAENNANVVLTKGTNIKLYSALCLDDKLPVTEANVANYKDNAILLTDISDKLTIASEITETMDGVAITFEANNVAKFTAEDNKTYVVEYINGSVKTYKVIKVGGAPSATYTLTLPDPAEVVEGGSIDVKVTEGTYAVTGAQNFFEADAFTVEESSTPGTYTLTAKAGTEGICQVKLNGTSETITVSAYEFGTTMYEITAGGDLNGEIKLYLGTPLADVNDDTNFVISDGLTITSVSGGVVNISAATTAKSGKIQFKNGGVVVAEAAITVNNYSFTAYSTVVNICDLPNIDSNRTFITMNLAGQPAANTAVTKNVDDTYAKFYKYETEDEPTTTTDDEGRVCLNVLKVPATDKFTVSAPDGNSIDIEVKNFKATFYNDEACSQLTKDSDGGKSVYYVKFTDNGVANWASIVSDQGTFTKTSTVGVYKFVPNSSSPFKVKYTYKGVTFTIGQRSFGV